MVRRLRDIEPAEELIVPFAISSIFTAVTLCYTIENQHVRIKQTFFAWI